MGKSGKPSVAIMQDFSVWVYNTSGTAITVSASELFGFGTGSFTDSAVSEQQALTEGTGVVWRLQDDFALISHNKQVVPLCEFLKTLANDHGLGQVELESHVLTEKHHPAVSRTVLSSFVIFGVTCFW